MHALLSFFHNSLVLEFSLLIFVKALILGVYNYWILRKRYILGLGIGYIFIIDNQHYKID